jgi:hypothetical protein
MASFFAPVYLVTERFDVIQHFFFHRFRNLEIGLVFAAIVQSDAFGFAIVAQWIELTSLWPVGIDLTQTFAVENTFSTNISQSFDSILVVVLGKIRVVVAHRGELLYVLVQ